MVKTFSGQFNPIMPTQKKDPFGLYGRGDANYAPDEIGGSMYQMDRAPSTFWDKQQFQSSYGPNSVNANMPAIAGKDTGINWFGSKEGGPGVAQLALGLVQGASSFHLGSRQVKLGEDQLRTDKQQFSKQFDLQKQNINRSLYDQGKARYLADKVNNPTPEEYYEKNKIKIT